MSTETAKRGRSTKIGIVTSSKAEKTVVVRVENLIMHPLYRRFMRTSSKFMAHDETNDCNAGDRVMIEECRPLSKNKRWRVRRVVERVR